MPTPIWAILFSQFWPGVRPEGPSAPKAISGHAALHCPVRHTRWRKRSRSEESSRSEEKPTTSWIRVDNIPPVAESKHFQMLFTGLVNILRLSLVWSHKARLSQREVWGIYYKHVFLFSTTTCHSVHDFFCGSGTISPPWIQADANCCCRLLERGL